MNCDQYYQGNALQNLLNSNSLEKQSSIVVVSAATLLHACLCHVLDCCQIKTTEET